MDLERVLKLKTPADQLVDLFRSDVDVSGFAKLHKHEPFASYVTLALVTDPDAVRSAKRYVVQLLRNRERYGFLYFLNTKKCAIPLNLAFNAHLIVDPRNHREIFDVFDGLARDFACPDERDNVYAITKVELLYFFTLLVNRHLTWVAVDHVLKCNRFHGYLYAAPERLL